MLVDAVTFTPLEIHAEPTGQGDRINALYRRWAQAFNLMGCAHGARGRWAIARTSSSATGAKG